MQARIFTDQLHGRENFFKSLYYLRRQIEKNSLNSKVKANQYKLYE